MTMDTEKQALSGRDVVTLTTGDEGQPPLISSAQLFKDQNTVRIAHEGNCYLLRITRENKLILTK